MSKLFRMTHVRPLGRAIPVDEELLAGLGDRRKEIAMFSDWQREPDYPPPVDVWELDRQAMLRDMQKPRWDRVLMSVGILAFCGVAWWLIILGARALGDWITGVGR